jgi:4-amino-4-deoxy-L-arabinose transferase-like glycosyltransferase
MLICLFGHLGAIGLVGPDEPRYAWIARAMAQTGDWVTPRLYGSPWFEKPVLYYWAAAIGFAVHLPAEWAARLPSALAALAAALSIAWLAWRFPRPENSHFQMDRAKNHDRKQYCPGSPALLAPLLFSTSFAAIGFARAATPDMLFASSLTLAMASAASTLGAAGIWPVAAHATSRNDVSSRTAIVCFGAFLGLGVLAKGPAAIVLAAGAIALWAQATQHWAEAFRLLHPYAIISFAVVALPWYILCALRHPDFIHVFIFQHNFERYFTPMFQHRQPFWFFIPITLLAILPWTAFLIPAARHGLGIWHQKTWSDSPEFFFACWAFSPILFFSFSQSKLPGYILPAIPPLALVLATSMAPLIESHSQFGHRIFIVLGLTWTGLAIGAPIWLTHLPRGAARETRPVIIASAVVTLGGAIAIEILASRRKRAAICVSLALVSLLVEIAGIAILPQVDPYYSARPAGTLLRGDLRPERLFTFNLPRAWQWGLAFYLGRELEEWQPTDREPALVLTTPNGLEQLEIQGYFRGTLAEPYQAIVFVPIPPRPLLHSRSR